MQLDAGVPFVFREVVVEALKLAATWKNVATITPQQHAVLEVLGAASIGRGALEAFGFKVVNLDAVGDALYAKAAREAVLSYLPSCDVDSAQVWRRSHRDDPTHLHLMLWERESGVAHYTSGFVHTLRARVGGHAARIIQLDHHSLLESGQPHLIAAKVALAQLIREARGKHGAVDAVFVEATSDMAARYREIEPRFRRVAERGASPYALLAMPLNAAAGRALDTDRRELFRAYLDAWFDKNLGANWRVTRPDAHALYKEMHRARTPRWSPPGVS